MKTWTRFSLMSLMVMLASASMTAQAQGRGHDSRRERGGDRDHQSTERYEARHHQPQARYEYRHDRHDARGHYYHYEPVRYRAHHHHLHDRACGHPIVIHRYERPRYVYYRDYDVYYDCHRHVYISYSGRSWSVSVGVPVTMRYADVNRTVRVGVDYYDDDFVQYLDAGRPMLYDEDAW